MTEVFPLLEKAFAPLGTFKMEPSERVVFRRCAEGSRDRSNCRISARRARAWLSRSREREAKGSWVTAFHFRRKECLKKEVMNHCPIRIHRAIRTMDVKRRVTTKGHVSARPIRVICQVERLVHGWVDPPAPFRVTS